MTKDMTNGNPIKLILTFSIPLLIGNVFQQFYNMVDAIIVGRYLGVDALAAVGSTGSMVFLVNGFVIGLTSGFAVLVAQRFGANDIDGVKKAFYSSIVLSMAMTIVVTFISILSAKPLLLLMNTPKNIMADSLKYVIIIYSGNLAIIFYNMLASILRSLGDSKTPLFFLIIASILNVILDLIFIINFSLGVAGAAYATIISQFVSALLCALYIIKKFPILKLNKSHMKLKKSYVIKQFKIGLPMALQFSITAIGIMVLQSALNNFGSKIIGAYTAASKVQQLVTQPCVTFGVTMATYSGQNLGAGKIDRIKEGVKKCVILSLCVSIFSSIMVFLFGVHFTKLFISSENIEALDYAKQYLNIVSIFYIPLGLIFIFRNTLQGIGESFIPMMAGAYEMIARIVVAFYLPTYIGFIGVALADPAAWLAAAIPLMIAYYKKINTVLSEKSLII